MILQNETHIFLLISNSNLAKLEKLSETLTLRHPLPIVFNEPVSEYWGRSAATNDFLISQLKEPHLYRFKQVEKGYVDTNKVLGESLELDAKTFVQLENALMNRRLDIHDYLARFIDVIKG